MGDQHLKTIHALQINRTLKALEANQMQGYYLSDVNQLIPLLETLITPEQVVSLGGSMTLFETGVIDWVRNYSHNLLDRYGEGLTADDITKIYRDTFSANVYLTSSNAVTEDGCLYNVDGRGNRVAAMTFGPDRVIVIVGRNKLVQNEGAAVVRNRMVAAPANAHRLSRKTPCVALGYCTDCHSVDRICSQHVLMKRQVVKDRIHVIIIEGEFGY